MMGLGFMVTHHYSATKPKTMKFSAPGNLLKVVLSFSNLYGAEICFTTRRSAGVDNVFFLYTFFPHH
jgi:hypothetical protein